MSTPTASIYSVQEGKKVSFNFSIENNEIVATHKDEFLKFPGGITKEELLAQIEAHNIANAGVKAISDESLNEQKEIANANARLLESLK